MGPRARLSRQAAVVVLLSIGAVAAGVWWAWASGREPLGDIGFSDLLTAVPAGRVSEVVVRDDDLRVRFADGRLARTIPPKGYVAANPTFVADLARAGVHITVDEGSLLSGPRGALFATLVGSAAIGIGLLFATGRLAAFRSPHTRAKRQRRRLTFADVAGVDEAREEVREIVEFLRDPDRFRQAGGRIPRGVLLIGPPGTGKTLLARAIAGEAGVPFLFASGSDFVEKFVGVGASRVRHLFRDARRHDACIVFVDELDAVGRQRGGNSTTHEEREQTLNQLLVEMDGFERHRNIVVMAATNRSDVLDPALLRPGRFDRQVHVGLADVKGRQAILAVHTRSLTLAPDVDLSVVARGTPGFSGADLANVVNEAALRAGREGRTAIGAADFEAARDKVLMGVERRSLVMTPSERLTCAYHEAGHAVVAACVPNTDPLHKVTIIPRGRALGVTVQLPTGDRHTHSKDYLEAQVAILMGGRIAEELFLQQKTSGAANDIERATDIAQRMVCVFGMSPLGMQSFGGTRDGDRTGPMSERTARAVDTEIAKVLADGYSRARRILEARRAAVQAIADRLLVVETMDAAEVLRLIADYDGISPAARVALPPA
jgi:cell division protease FtsH